MQKKFFICALAICLTACVNNDSQEEWGYYPEESFAPLPAQQAPKTETTPTKTKLAEPKRFSSSKTYMKELAQKLKKEAQKAHFKITQQENKIAIIMPNRTLFGTNNQTIEAQTEPVLSAMARILNEYDATQIHIVGYTDNKGLVSDLKDKSLAQANAVFNFLRLNNININRITVDGLGPQNPTALNSTPAGRARNNRVEIILTNMQ